MSFQIESSSSCGAYRSNNEDAVEFGELEERDFFWMVIADGMGGHQAGEVASEMLVNQVVQQVESLNEARFPHGRKFWLDWIENAFLQANEEILRAAQKSAELQGMGTTGVILVIHAREFFIGWVGDSRAYHWRHNQLQQLTRDHSAIQYLLDKGSITEDEAKRSNTRHLLARAVGIKTEIEVDLITNKVSAGDIILLSTDGLHDVLSSEVISAYLGSFASSESVVESLVNQAIVQGSKDNISLGVVKIVD